MAEEKKRTSFNSPDSLFRLPEGFSIGTLCKMKGLWPKRELSQEELIETYKNHYSAAFRRELIIILGALVEKYGQEIYDVVEEINYKIGEEEGAAYKKHYKSLLNKMVDISVRPFCYEIFHVETSNEKIVYKVLKCPFANIIKEMNAEEIGKHICPRWHEGYAEAFGYRFRMPKFLLDGDDCCEQIWERK